ncbi:MAG: hypothetical protein R3C68_12725 [Myxococcota bacterium]
MPTTLVTEAHPDTYWNTMRSLGLGMFAAGTSSAAVALWSGLSAENIKHGISADDSNERATRQAKKIRQRNRMTRIAAGAAGATLVTGAILFLWPKTPQTNVVVSPDGVGFGWSF